MYTSREVVEYDVIVIGGGVSGLIAASIIASQKKKVIVVDEYKYLGGNHISQNIGNYTFDIGSFFFHDDSAFFSHFPSLLSLYIRAGASVGKIKPDGSVTTYPVDLRSDILSLSVVEKIKVIFSLLYARLCVNPNRSALDFTVFWIGRRFGVLSGLIPYLERFYSTDPSLIEAEFAKKRMGWVARTASVKGLLSRLRKRRGQKKNNPYIRPRDGFSCIYEGARRLLESSGVTVALSVNIKKINRVASGRMELVLADRTINAREIYSTVPLADSLSWCNLHCPPVLYGARLVTLFYTFNGERGFIDNVLYNFSCSGLWKRLTVHSDYYGTEDGTSYFSVETTVCSEQRSIDYFDADFRADVTGKGIFRGNLSLVGSHTLEHAYPLYLSGAIDATAVARRDLDAYGVKSFGRQGAYDYQPTADVSSRMAENFVEGARNTTKSATTD